MKRGPSCLFETKSGTGTFFDGLLLVLSQDTCGAVPGTSLAAVIALLPGCSAAAMVALPTAMIASDPGVESVAAIATLPPAANFPDLRGNVAVRTPLPWGSFSEMDTVILGGPLTAKVLDLGGI